MASNHRDDKSMPPRHVYSAIFNNTSGSDLKISCMYENSKGEQNWVSKDVANGGDVSFEMQTCEIDEMVQAKAIEGVKVEGLGDPVEQKAPFNVWSPTRDHKFFITAEGGKVVVTNPEVK
eukprot:TRINITY_DN115421_c0_g1_i1.p1 TRINITY_DN115421_c0_g1~~TRINITY_DN115421_c0_g1_i1.p1  ORF type:complete len:120 (-),score=23.70 TRINITY_DN115421_c0_g1_i1:189-548(-)